MIDSPARNAQPLSNGQQLAYACGDLSSNLVWGLTLSFLMYYYTDIYVIPAAVVAWLLLVPRALDAMIDPLVGYWVDRTSGRYVMRLLGGLAIPFGLVAFFCFLPLPLSPTGKIVWACSTYLVLGAVYSTINTPYGVLSNMMAVNTRERVSLNSFRMAGCQLGLLIVSSATLPAITWIGGGTSVAQQRDGMIWVAAAIGVTAAILWIITARGCRVRRLLPLERQNPRTLLRALLTNRRYHLSNVLTYLNFTVFCAQIGLTIHYTRLILNRPASDAAFVLTCTTIAAIVGVMLVSLPVRRIGVRRTYLCLLAFELACLLLILTVGDSFALFLLVVSGHALANGPVSPLCLSIVSEAVDERRAETGVAAAGVAFATNTLIGKFAAGMTGFLVATSLANGGYSPTLATAGPDLAWWLKAGFVGLPVCAVTIAFVVVFLSRKDHAAAALEPAAI